MFFYLFCVQGGYEAVPTRDIHMNQIGKTTMQRFGSVGLDPNNIGKMRLKNRVPEPSGPGVFSWSRHFGLASAPP